MPVPLACFGVKGKNLHSLHKTLSLERAAGCRDGRPDSTGRVASATPGWHSISLPRGSPPLPLG